jgi:hypothetical protein
MKISFNCSLLVLPNEEEWLIVLGCYSLMEDCLDAELILTQNEYDGKTVKYLTLPADRSWHLNMTIDTNKLLIPLHFEKYKDAILGCLDTCYESGTYGNAYVSGSAGIGKTVLLVYIMYSLLHPPENQPVPWIVFQPDTGRNWGLIYYDYQVYRTQLMGPGIAEVAEEVAFAWNEIDGGGYFLVDTNLPWWNAMRGDSSNFSHIVVSNYEHRFNDPRFGQWVDRVPNLTFILPPWELKDILHLKDVCFPQDSSDEYKDMFEIFGGNVSAVLDNYHLTQEQRERLILEKIDRVDIPEAIKSLEANHSDKNTQMGDFWSFIPEALQCLDGKGHYLSRYSQIGRYEWTSPILADAAAQKLRTLKPEEITDFLDTGMLLPNSQILRGKLLERVFHRTVSLKSIFGNFWYLDDYGKWRESPSSFLELPRQKIHFFWKIEEIVNDCYNVPLDPAFAGVSAILPSLGVILQLNIGQTNRVQVETLKLLHDNNVFRKFFARKKGSKVRFIFVLDPRRYKEQPYADSSNSDRLNDVPWLEQRAWEFGPLSIRPLLDPIPLRFGTGKKRSFVSLEQETQGEVIGEMRRVKRSHVMEASVRPGPELPTPVAAGKCLVT